MRRRATGGPSRGITSSLGAPKRNDALTQVNAVSGACARFGGRIERASRAFQPGPAAPRRHPSFTSRARITAANEYANVSLPAQRRRAACGRLRKSSTLSRNSLVLFACGITATHQNRSRVWFPWPGQWRPMPGYPERPIAVHAPNPERPSTILPGREGAALCPHRTRHRAFIDDLERLRKHL
jgi:hypothetical protein